MRKFPFLAQVVDHLHFRHLAVLVLSVVGLFNFSIGGRQLMKLVRAPVPILPLIYLDIVSSLVTPAVRVVFLSLAVDPSVKLVRLASIIIVVFSFMFFPIVGPYSFIIIVSKIISSILIVRYHVVSLNNLSNLGAVGFQSERFNIIVDQGAELNRDSLSLRKGGKRLRVIMDAGDSAARGQGQEKSDSDECLCHFLKQIIIEAQPFYYSTGSMLKY